MYRVGKSMDDGVQRGKVQGTTCRKNKQNEGVHNGRIDSGKRTGGERLPRELFFFLLFPLCRGEAGLLVTAKYGYFRNLLPSVPIVGLFSPFFFLRAAFLRSLFTQSSHLILAVVFPVFLLLS